MRHLLVRLHTERSVRPPDFDSWPIQLGMHGDPWRVLVACRLLNRTTGCQVRPVLRELLTRWPTAADAATCHVADLRSVVAPLGLYEARSRDIALMSRAFLFGDWIDVMQLPGVGRYAWDAVQIFCLGRLTVEPEDKVLRAFVGALR